MVASFSVAASRKYNNNAGYKVEETTWFKCSIWGTRAEKLTPYLVKGKLVHITVRLQTDGQGNPRVWTNQDGVAKASFEINVNDLTFLGGARSEAVEQEAPAHTDAADIPF